MRLSEQDASGDINGCNTLAISLSVTHDFRSIRHEEVAFLSPPLVMRTSTLANAYYTRLHLSGVSGAPTANSQWGEPILNLL